MEILTPAQYPEYEAFVQSHPQGGFTQSTAWPKVKNNWESAVVASRDGRGSLVGGMLVLIQPIPQLHTSFLYAPRGPVCDLHDQAVLADLVAGADLLAKKYHAHTFKMDPDVPMADRRFQQLAQQLGFAQSYGPDGFEGIQARFNYRLYLNGRTEDQLFMDLTQGARRKVRIALKNGVQVRPVGPEYLGQFMELMRATGQRDGFNIRPQSYFARMLEALGDHVRLYMGFYQGQPVCGAITTNYAGKTCYVYGASGNTHREVMPNYLMQWEMIRWAVQTGCTVYDFQGVSGNLQEGSHMYGLYQFKRGFNGQLDELAGEFDRVYHPVTAKLVDAAIVGAGQLRSLRRRMGR